MLSRLGVMPLTLTFCLAILYTVAPISAQIFFVPNNQQCGGMGPACALPGRQCLDGPWPNARCVANHFCHRDNAWWWVCRPSEWGNARDPCERFSSPRIGLASVTDDDDIAMVQTRRWPRIARSLCKTTGSSPLNHYFSHLRADTTPLVNPIPNNQQCGGRSAPGCGAVGRACADAAFTVPKCVAGHFCWRDNEWWWSCQPSELGR